jgi:hypothetical protein
MINILKVKVDAGWIGLERPFYRLKIPPENPYQFRFMPAQVEPISACFYPTGELQYLFSRLGYHLFLHRERPSGYLQTELMRESFEQDGYICDSINSDVDIGWENKKLILYEDWVKRSIDYVCTAQHLNLE